MASSAPMFSAFFLGFFLLISAAPYATNAGGSLEEARHLHFYFKETYAGPEQSNFVVASLNNTSFGTIRIFDNPILEGPEESSALIGRLQGTAAVASLGADQSLHVSMDIVFTAGEFNGSTLSVVGRADPTASSIERPVVGGTGKLQRARGTIVSRIVGGSSTHIIAENFVYLYLLGAATEKIVVDPLHPQKKLDV